MNRYVAFALGMGPTLGIIFMNLPPAMEPLIAVYGCSYTGFSVIVSALFWAYTLMQVPGGLILDRLGLKRTLLICLSTLVVADLLPALYPNWGLAVAGRLLTGMGAGLVFVTPMKMMALYAPPGRAGIFQAFYGALVPVGSVFAYLVVPVLVPFGWQWAFVVAALCWLPLLAMVPALKLPRREAAPQRRLELGRIARDARVWALGIYLALSFGSGITMAIWVPTLLADVLPGKTAAHLAWSGALIMGLSFAGRLSGGLVLFRLSAYRVAGGTIGLLCLLFLGLSLGGLPPALTLGLALAATGCGALNFGSLFQLAGKIAPPERLGGLIGSINFLANLGAGLMILFFGMLKDYAGDFTWGFLALAALSLAALIPGQLALKNLR